MSEENTTTLRVAYRVELDYVDPLPELLENLSGCAANGQNLWTVSDEGRTIACLERYKSGYRLSGTIEIDHWISAIPGSQDDELDLESLDYDAGALWICGAHCKVRRKPQAGEPLSPDIRERKSRRLLARIAFGSDGRTPIKANWLPFEGDGSLLQVLQGDPFLLPYRELPTKENGIDIEGLAIVDGRVFVGLRGPMVGGFAVIVELSLDEGFRIASAKRHFLKLDGRAVRELAREGSNLLIIGGPVGESQGSFALYRWSPEDDAVVTKIFEWGSILEKPEGMCLTSIEGSQGLLMLYDSPDARIHGAKFEADWFEGTVI